MDLKRHISSRQLLIFEYLKHHDTVTAEEIANYIGVSKRTIKKDLTLLMSEIRTIKSSPAKGYWLEKSENIVEAANLEIIRDKDLILNNYDRVAYLVQKLLLVTGDIRYEELAEELYISVSSLKSDMKKVKIFIGKYGLKVMHKPNYGIKIIGTEYYLRLAIADFFYHSFLSYLSNYNQKIYLKDSPKLERICKIVKLVIHENSIDISDYSINDLAIHIFISLERIDKSNEIFVDVSNISEKDIKVVEKIYTLLEEEVDEATINYISLHLSSKKIISNESQCISRKIEKIILDIISEINSNFDIDFSVDKNFLKILTSHISQLMYRVVNDLSVPNSQVFEYFRDYLFAAKITISAISILEKILKKKISIDEYGYLILYFQYELESMNSKKEIIYLYTGNSRSEEKFYEILLQNTLNTQRNTIVPIKDINDAKEDGIIVSTSSEDFDFIKNKNIIPSFNKSKIPNILEKKRNFRKEILEKYITKDSILIIDSVNRKEVELLILKHLNVKNYLKENIEEKLFFQEVGNGIVHIQDLYKIIKKEICLVVLLKKPMLWENTVIKTLFMIKTKKDGDQDLGLLCNVFSSWINSPEDINYLHEYSNEDILLEMLVR